MPDRLHHVIEGGGACELFMSYQLSALSFQLLRFQLCLPREIHGHDSVAYFTGELLCFQLSASTLRAPTLRAFTLSAIGNNYLL